MTGKRLIDHFMPRTSANRRAVTRRTSSPWTTQYTDQEQRHAAYNRVTYRGLVHRHHTAIPTLGLHQTRDPLKSDPYFKTGPIGCLTATQVETELETRSSNSTNCRPGMSTIYYLLTPPGVGVCLDAGA